eukprot:452103-Rhodomonas_salina.3
MLGYGYRVPGYPGYPGATPLVPGTPVPGTGTSQGQTAEWQPGTTPGAQCTQASQKWSVSKTEYPGRKG